MSWLTDLKDDYVRCRDLGHVWTEGGDYKMRVARGMVGRELTCDHCGTQRLDIFIERTGELEMRRYIYPDGYQRPSGVESFRKVQFRKEWFNRIDEETPTERIKMVFERKPGWREM